jgi:hypothetical protein
MTKKTPKFKSSYNLGLKIMKQTPLNPTHIELSNNTYKTNLISFLNKIIINFK